MTPTQAVKTSVSTNNSPSQDYANPDDRPTTNTTLCCKYQLYGHNNIDSEDESHTGCLNVSHYQQQSFSGLHRTGWSTNHAQTKTIYDYILGNLYSLFLASCKVGAYSRLRCLLLIHLVRVLDINVTLGKQR